MVSAIIIIIFIALFAAYDKNEHLRKKRKRILAEELELQREKAERRKNYPDVIVKVQFPNPATSPIEDVNEFLCNEIRTSVLTEYVRIAKELNSPDVIISAIEKREQYCREIYD